MNVLHKDMLLYAITDNRCLNGVSLEEQVRLALEGGATFLQLRDKESSHEELVKKAIALKNIAKEFNVSKDTVKEINLGTQKRCKDVDFEYPIRVRRKTHKL